MALNVRGFRAQLRATTQPYGTAAGDLKVTALDEGNATGRPWQAFNVIAVDVDQEKNPTEVVLTIKPRPGQHG